MVKQKIMYLLCLLMFAVGINAQDTNFTPGTVDRGTSSDVDSRSAKGVTQSATYDAATGLVTFKFVVTSNDHINNPRAGQVVTITDLNLDITSVKINNIAATKSPFSGQGDGNQEAAIVYNITSGVQRTSTIEVTIRPGNAGDLVKISKLYTWQGDLNYVNQAAGHLNQNAPLTFTYNYIGIGGPNGITYQTPVPDSVKPSITASDIIVYRGEQVSNKTMTVSDDKGLKTITVSNSPAVEGEFTIPTVNGQTSATVTLKLSDAGGLVPLNKERVTQGLIDDINRERETSHTITATDNANNVQTATFKVIVRTQTQAYTASEKAGIRKRFNLNSTAPTPESLVSVVKDVSTLPSIPRNATYTYVTAPKMDQAGVQTVTVRVKYEDDSYDDVDIVFDIINRNPIIDQLPIPIRVWKDQPVQNPIKVPANDPDGTIVSVRLASENGLTATYDNGIITIAGTPTVVSNGMTYIFATDNNGGRGSRLIDFVIMDAKGGKITKNWDETVSQQEVLDKVTIIDTSTAHRNVTRTILDPIPSYQDIKNGASPIVRVELVTETGEKKIVEVEIEYIISFCTKPANTTGAALNTIVGITDLGRAESNGNLNDDTSWPMMRKGGWLALESNNKGFVVTRMTTTQITAISTPQEGMMVYDTTAKCLKLYDGTKWSCFSQPVCPKF